jgi:hypothetical protein
MNIKQTEALKQALEAMNAMLTHMGMDEDDWNKVTFDQMRRAITALRTAIDQAEKQEPVACGHCNGSGRMVRDPDIGTDQECFVCDGSGVTNTPPAAQRQWVGLTDEEVDHIADEHATLQGAIRAIEAKLREKNA